MEIRRKEMEHKGSKLKKGKYAFYGEEHLKETGKRRNLDWKSLFSNESNT